MLVSEWNEISDVEWTGSYLLLPRCTPRTNSPAAEIPDLI